MPAFMVSGKSHFLCGKTKRKKRKKAKINKNKEAEL